LVGILGVRYVTWTGFFSEYLFFPLSVSFLQRIMVISPSNIDAKSSWRLTPLSNNTDTGEEASIQDLWDVTLFRISGSRRFEGSWCFKIHGQKQSKNPCQHHDDNLKFRILKGFNAKRNYPLGLCNIFFHILS
jgi:hypothetical protein